MKWFSSVVEWFKDIAQFLAVRSQQKRTYGSVVDDLEELNRLSAALNWRVQEFAKKYQLFPDVCDALKEYSHYIANNQAMYQAARIKAINSLLAEHDRPQLSVEAGAGVGVMRSNTEIRERIGVRLASAISKYKPFLANILGRCRCSLEGTCIIIDMSGATKTTVEIIMKNKAMIAGCAKEMLEDDDVTVEFVSGGNDNG